MDFAAAVNQEARALQAAGADVIQLDEPWLRNDPEAARRIAVRAIDAGSTGELTITAAPLGRAAEASAQTGSLRLRTAGGHFLTLDLGTGRISREPHGAPLP